MLAVNLAIMLNLEQNLKLKPALKVSIKGLIIVLPVAAFFSGFFYQSYRHFWQLPQPQKEAKTGLSENVDPFDIVSLSQSEELVFRATFENEQIEGPYYWRAIIHDEFDGKRWKISEYQRTNMKPPPLDEGEHATIIAQPSYIPWLYGLSYSYSNNPKLNSNVFGTVYLKSLTSKPIEYSIMVSDFSPESTLKPWYYQRNVKIPKGLTLKQPS